MNKYDIVIVNYNGEKIIKRCLESIYSSSVLPNKIIIYDNNSQDNSIEIIKKKFPDVILIEDKKNIGFGPANNKAMEYSTSDFILFMNNDIILDKYCTRELLKGFLGSNIALLNPLIYKGWNKKQASEIYSFGAEINKSGFGYSLLDSNVDRTDLSCFSGACFMAKRQVISKLNFEPTFFLYYEEPDLSVRLLIRKEQIGRLTNAKCYHLESYSSPKNIANGICFRQFYSIQNRWYMLGKYWPAWPLLKALPLNIFHLFYNVFFFLKNGKLKEVRIIYLAFVKLYLGRKRYKKSNNYLWLNMLSKTKVSKLLVLQKKVYR